MPTSSPHRSGGQAARSVSLAVVAAAALIAATGYGLARDGTAHSATPAAESAQQFVGVVRAVSPSVVQIESASGLGSGVVYDAAGHVVTNAHVVGTARELRVTLADGRRVSGTLVGRFVPDDLAVVKIAATGLRPMQLERSARVAVGELTLAIGNPLGLRSSVTDGIVSAVGRTVSEPNGAVLPNVVQTSAPINPGNSGGALVDLEGKLIGIPTVGVEGGNGIGFAIASDRVKLIADQLIRDGRVVDTGRAYLGVRLAALDDVQGVVVAEVVAGGPAAKAGLRAGDVIATVAGRATPTPADLAAVLAAKAPGDTVAVEAVRDGTSRRLDVTLGKLPAAQG